MFNIGFSELIIVLLIAFLVVGPKDLPRVARWLGRMVRKLRNFIRDVKKETGWDDIEREFKDTSSDLKKTLKEADIRDDLRATKTQLDKDLSGIGKELRDVTGEAKRQTEAAQAAAKTAEPKK